MEVNFKKLHPAAIPFRYSREGDACMDMYALSETRIKFYTWKLIKTGIAVEIPPGYEGRVRGRSGYTLREGIWVFGGTIDETYRGDVGVIIFNTTHESILIPKGARIAQFSINPVYHINLVEKETLSETVRGEQGYGSSGK